MSFWYIVNHFGRRFHREAREFLGTIEEASPGVWRGQVLQPSLFLVDGRTVPVDRESVPVHLVGEESLETEQALARVIVDEPGLWEVYGSLLGVLHPAVFEEASRMAKSKGKQGGLDLRPFIEKVGLKNYLTMFDADDIIDVLGPEKLAQVLGNKRILARLSAEQRRQLKEQLK